MDHSRHCRHGRPVWRVTARFVAGATPSWADGDVYQLKMLATSGAGRARTPSDESMAWTGSTQIDITPTGSGTADTLMLALHTIASTATVTLSGSNDNWATTAVTHAGPVGGRNHGAAVRVRHLQSGA